jgi:hypothetical protein
MEIKNTVYILTKFNNDEVVYIASNDNPDGKWSYYELTNDIGKAIKCGNKATALVVKDDYEKTENHSCESEFEIIPLNITYEW